LGGLGKAALTLEFPLSEALAPYNILLMTIGGFGAIALALLAAGSWGLARSLTRPISALQRAVLRLRDGQQAEVEVQGRDEIAGLAHSFNAMAEEIRARESRIWHMARHDHETELPNRLALDQAVLGLAETPGQAVYVAAIGHDRFDHVRAAIGYRLSGELIKQLGHRLMSALGGEGGERVGLISNALLGVVFVAESDVVAEARISELLAHIEQPVAIGGNTVDLILSAGIGRQEAGPGGTLSVVDRSSIALDQCRERNRKTGLFDAEAYGDPASKLSMMSEMLTALSAGFVQPHYQPKYDVRQGKITGCEALVRWIDPVRGFVPPDAFIPMAEETGAIRQLTEALLARSISDQNRMVEQGLDISVSVNVSGRLLSDEGFAAEALRLAASARGKLCFEVTETAVIEQPELAMELMEQFRAARIDISIDDYGSGLSSLSYLKQIRAQELKIDRGFVAGMANGRRDILLVRSTVDLAHGLGMKVTAEGVETAMEMTLLTSMGCDMIQGWYVAKPMPLDKFVEFSLTPSSPSIPGDVLLGSERLAESRGS
jgi:EAL domain-containing protein (putative c-di-GMP-specific phosphodiesterase class I)/GGDEF domain-containing protein